MKEQARTNVAIAPVQHGMHHMPGAVNYLPMGYPIMQQPLMPSTGYPQINSMGTISSCHGVMGIPASENFLHMQQNCAKEYKQQTAKFSNIFQQMEKVETKVIDNQRPK